MWGGVDVGQRERGFHAAVVDDRRLVDVAHVKTANAVVEWLGAHEPRVIGVDSPRTPARQGEASRDDERALARAVCGLYYTPERARLEANAFYAWVLHGFELYTALDERPWRVVEVFPTASWTRWGGRRGDATRRAWSKRVLHALELEGVPPRLGQDERDAIGAALTARSYDRGLAESFGDIVVPVA